MSEELLLKLRDLCSRFGDNDWSDEAAPEDVIENHLANYLSRKVIINWKPGDQMPQATGDYLIVLEEGETRRACSGWWNQSTGVWQAYEDGPPVTPVQWTFAPDLERDSEVE